jgi:hypothetical protein
MAEGKGGSLWADLFVDPMLTILGVKAVMGRGSGAEHDPTKASDDEFVAADTIARIRAGGPNGAPAANPVGADFLVGLVEYLKANRKATLWVRFREALSRAKKENKLDIDAAERIVRDVIISYLPPEGSSPEQLKQAYENIARQLDAMLIQKLPALLGDYWRKFKHRRREKDQKGAEAARQFFASLNNEEGGGNCST